MLSHNQASIDITRTTGFQQQSPLPAGPHIEQYSNTDSHTAQQGHQQMHGHHAALQALLASNTVGITSNQGQQQPQHTSQVAQQHVQTPAVDSTPFHSLTALPNAPDISVQGLTRQQYRALAWQRFSAQVDAEFDELKSTPNLVRIERSQSDQGPAYVLQHQLQWATTGGSSEDAIHHPSCDLRPTSSRSLGSEDRIPAPQEWMMHSQRPRTPQNQSSPAYSPITPAQTPHSHGTLRALAQGQTTPCQIASPHSEHQSTVKASRTRPQNVETQAQAGSLQPAIEFSATDPNSTIKASNHSKTLSKDFFKPSNGEGLPSPPGTITLGHQRKFDATAFSDEPSLDDLPKFTFPPVANVNIADFSSASLFADIASMDSDHHRHKPNQSSSSDFNPRTPSGGGHSARSSVDLSAFGSPSAHLFLSPNTMAMNDLSMETNMTYEDTGVSAEEVQSYIHEDFTNTKTPFTCSYPQCGKNFGRRENIRSHIQTHLDDRQFRCLNCNARFVRQHDLKRHTKIHTLEKPYKCACGNGFARQDALTRHRQRGICKGGDPNVQRSPAKRGRPRKHPIDDADRDKPTKRRKRDDGRNYASSNSGLSEGSSFQSPVSTPGGDMNLDRGMSDEEIRLLSGASSENGVSGSQAGSPSETLETLTAQASPFSQVDNGAQYLPDGTVCLADLSRPASRAGSHALSQLGSSTGSPPGLSHSSPPSSAQHMDCDSISNVLREECNAIAVSSSSNSTERANNEMINRMLLDNAMFGNIEVPQFVDNLYEYNKNSTGDDVTSFSGFIDTPLFSELEGRYR